MLRLREGLRSIQSDRLAPLSEESSGVYKFMRCPDHDTNPPLIEMAHISKLFFTLLFSLLFQTHASVSSAVPRPAARDLSPQALSRRAVTPSSRGTIGNYFYFWWTDGGASTAEYTNIAPGSFS